MKFRAVTARAMPYLMVLLFAGGAVLWVVDLSDPVRAERMRAEAREIAEDESRSLEARIFGAQRLRIMEDRSERAEAAGSYNAHGSAALIFLGVSSAGVMLVQLARAEREDREEVRARG